ncbi:hypothetical protein LR48_Vigan05g140000 [Vigna angularis]|uniref:Uncharacterized protein n=1 Tax=Phaseolus angularis TaxID=3914 RepID=A0A0L9ULL1_PHAAN|nr:hypothetical protein LR48_Vigan05g140000 [Vigna angularis]
MAEASWRRGRRSYGGTTQVAFSPSLVVGGVFARHLLFLSLVQLCRIFFFLVFLVLGSHHKERGFLSSSLSQFWVGFLQVVRELLPPRRMTSFFGVSRITRVSVRGVFQWQARRFVTQGSRPLVSSRIGGGSLSSRSCVWCSPFRLGFMFLVVLDIPWWFWVSVVVVGGCTSGGNFFLARLLLFTSSFALRAEFKTANAATLPDRLLVKTLVLLDRDSSRSYIGGSESDGHSFVINEACSMFAHTNPLHLDVFKSVARFEAEVVAMTTTLLGIDKNFQADLKAIRRHINKNTIMELGHLASSFGICFHVDLCLGGFVLPFARELGYPIPPFDFSVKGVSPISVDVHKYGLAPKGTSIVLYRNHEIRKHRGDWFVGKLCALEEHENYQELESRKSCKKQVIRRHMKTFSRRAPHKVGSSPIYFAVLTPGAPWRVLGVVGFVFITPGAQEGGWAPFSAQPLRQAPQRRGSGATLADVAP